MTKCWISLASVVRWMAINFPTTAGFFQKLLASRLVSVRAAMLNLLASVCATVFHAMKVLPGSATACVMVLALYFSVYIAGLTLVVALPAPGLNHTAHNFAVANGGCAMVKVAPLAV